MYIVTIHYENVVPFHRILSLVKPRERYKQGFQQLISAANVTPRTEKKNNQKHTYTKVKNWKTVYLQKIKTFYAGKIKFGMFLTK